MKNPKTLKALTEQLAQLKTKEELAYKAYEKLNNERFNAKEKYFQEYLRQKQKVMNRFSNRVNKAWDEYYATGMKQQQVEAEIRELTEKLKQQAIKRGE